MGGMCPFFVAVGKGRGQGCPIYFTPGSLPYPLPKWLLTLCAFFIPNMQCDFFSNFSLFWESRFPTSLFPPPLDFPLMLNHSRVFIRPRGTAPERSDPVSRRSTLSQCILGNHYFCLAEAVFPVFCANMRVKIWRNI